MSYVRCLRGIGSGKEYPPESVMNLCPQDGRPVEIVYDLERLKAEKPNLGWYDPGRNDMWRFGGLLPLDITNPADFAQIVTLGEGCTPLLDFSDHPLARQAGFRLQIKEEGRASSSRRQYGSNPTMSFKDRGMAVVVSMARKLGLKKLVVPTQGNAGDALAEYGLAAGLEVAIVMPEETDMPILGKVAAYAKLHPKIHLDLVKGTIREAGLLVEQKYLGEGYFSVATFQEPGWRIEGKKTMGLELAEPRKTGEPWKLPDVIVYPAGGGTGLLGMWKGFAELGALEVIDERRPRMVAVQSQSTPSIVNAFDRHAQDTELIQAGKTVATGLNVPGGVGHFKVLDILYQSDGCAIAVSEQAILENISKTFRSKGWWFAPEGAATLAALEQLVERDVIRSGDHVVCFNTASAEKYLPSIRDRLTLEG